MTNKNVQIGLLVPSNVLHFTIANDPWLYFLIALAYLSNSAYATLWSPLMRFKATLLPL